MLSLNKIKQKEWLYRAISTFFQSFFGFLATSIVYADLTSFSVIRSLLISAIASGISAVMNLGTKGVSSNEQNV